MKPLMAGLLLAALAGLADAQTVVPEGPQQDGMVAQRARISAERTRLEAGFAAENAVCYEKFAVNNCLDKISARRRQAMAELRRQEILLNDEERKRRGEEQIRKTREKSSPEKLQEAAERRAKAVEDYQSRLKTGKSQQKEPASVSSSENAARSAYAQKLRDEQKKVQARAERQATNAENAKKFQARQKEAQERQAEHEADQLKRGKTPGKSLPLPALPQ
jgi:hypothetical protein